MNYNLSKPSVFLSEYVKYYWDMEHRFPIGTVHTQRIVPSGLFEIIFYLNEKPKSSDESRSVGDNIIITGQLKDYYDLKVAGKMSLFSIYFRPFGLSCFLDIPLKELFNKSVPLRFLLPDVINKLEDELYEAGSFQERIVITEKFLAQQIKKNRKNYHYDRIKHIIHIINKAKSGVDIDMLAAEACLGRKQFERVFMDIIGVSPKQFLKIIRFQQVVFEKSVNNRLNLTEMAYSCGYYDQSHMINDFKSLTGFTPRRYFDVCEPFSDYFN